MDPDLTLAISAADPVSGSGAFLTPGSGIFRVKILKFFDADADTGSGNLFDPGSGILDGKIRIRYKHPGSATLTVPFQIGTYGASSSFFTLPTF
jgi:hypothetical protein